MGLSDDPERCGSDEEADRLRRRSPSTSHSGCFSTTRATLAFDVFTHRLPAWGVGCVVFTHPLELGSGFVLLGSAIAVGPWLFALGRNGAWRPVPD